MSKSHSSHHLLESNRGWNPCNYATSRSRYKSGGRKSCSHHRAIHPSRPSMVKKTMLQTRPPPMCCNGFCWLQWGREPTQSTTTWRLHSRNRLCPYSPSGVRKFWWTIWIYRNSHNMECSSSVLSRPWRNADIFRKYQHPRERDYNGLWRPQCLWPFSILSWLACMYVPFKL